MEQFGLCKTGRAQDNPRQQQAVRVTMVLLSFQHPYPTEDEKRQIAAQTNLTLLQVNNWGGRRQQQQEDEENPAPMAETTHDQPRMPTRPSEPLAVPPPVPGQRDLALAPLPAGAIGGGYMAVASGAM
ncbi:UNVERIFIED_CONTAM: hypothetical protein K2H54_026077 [Gekko kuhli]